MRKRWLFTCLLTLGCGKGSSSEGMVAAPPDSMAVGAELGIFEMRVPVRPSKDVGDRAIALVQILLGQSTVDAVSIQAAVAKEYSAEESWGAQLPTSPPLVLSCKPETDELHVGLESSGDPGNLDEAAARDRMMRVLDELATVKLVDRRHHEASLAQVSRKVRGSGTGGAGGGTIMTGTISLHSPVAERDGGPTIVGRAKLTAYSVLDSNAPPVDAL